MDTNECTETTDTDGSVLVASMDAQPQHVEEIPSESEPPALEAFADIQVHPYAASFPMIEGEDFDDFVEDIRANGLRTPITLERAANCSMAETDSGRANLPVSNPSSPRLTLTRSPSSSRPTSSVAISQRASRRWHMRWRIPRGRT